MKTQLKQSLGALYNNFDLITMPAYDLFRGTPVYRVIGKLFHSKYKTNYLSDIGRAVLLYKYGGLYSDSDGFLARNIDELGHSFIARNPNGNLASGFSAARKKNLYLLEVLKRIAENFTPTGTYFQIFSIHIKTVKSYCTETCKVQSAVYGNNNHNNSQCCELKLLGKFWFSNKTRRLPGWTCWRQFRDSFKNFRKIHGC